MNPGTSVRPSKSTAVAPGCCATTAGSPTATIRSPSSTTALAVGRVGSIVRMDPPVNAVMEVMLAELAPAYGRLCRIVRRVAG